MTYDVTQGSRHRGADEDIVASGTARRRTFARTGLTRHQSCQMTFVRIVKYENKPSPNEQEALIDLSPHTVSEKRNWNTTAESDASYSATFM